jgi:predicted lipoprotein
VWAEPFDHRGLAVDFLEQFVRPGATGFAARAGEVRDTLAALCEQVDSQSLGRARTAFAGAALAYARIDAIRFGPNRQANRQERLMLYPDPKGLVRRQVETAIGARDAGLLDPATLYGKSVALQGFPALELLLYGEAADALAGPEDAARFRCGYAQAISTNIARIAADMARDWADPTGYSGLMLGPAADNPAYLDEEEVTLEIAQTFINGLETVRDVRLAAPAGLRAHDKAPTPALLERSGLSLPYLGANIAGLLALWRDGRLEQRAALHDRPIAEQVGLELERVQQLLANVSGGMAEARQNGPARQGLIALGFPLRNARLLAADLLAEATQLSVGFNAGDGD